MRNSGWIRRWSWSLRFTKRTQRVEQSMQPFPVYNRIPKFRKFMCSRIFKTSLAIQYIWFAHTITFNFYTHLAWRKRKHIPLSGKVFWEAAWQQGLPVWVHLAKNKPILFRQLLPCWLLHMQFYFLESFSPPLVTQLFCLHLPSIILWSEKSLHFLWLGQ